MVYIIVCVSEEMQLISVLIGVILGTFQDSLIYLQGKRAIVLSGLLVNDNVAHVGMASYVSLYARYIDDYKMEVVMRRGAIMVIRPFTGGN